MVPIYINLMPQYDNRKYIHWLTRNTIYRLFKAFLFVMKKKAIEKASERETNEIETQNDKKNTSNNPPRSDCIPTCLDQLNCQ